MYWILGLAVLVLAGAGAFYLRRRQKRRKARHISLVGLLREPVSFEPGILARVAGKAWNADLGDGSSEGTEGFVIGTEFGSPIMHEGRMTLFHQRPEPYVTDKEAVAEGIPDLRIRTLLLEHEAWFSCDAIGPDGTTSEEEIREWYSRLGTLFAELIDDNCLMVLLPDTNEAFPVNEETEAALRSDDPLSALRESMNVPLIEVAADDPLMVEAVSKARTQWPDFVNAYELKAGEGFSIKAPVTHSGNTEFIWISVTTIEGEKIYGKLGNDPANLGPLKLGSNVSVGVEVLNDWMYFDPEGNLHGGFTVEAVRQAAMRKRQS